MRHRERGGIPLALVLIALAVILGLGLFFGACDALIDDESEEGDLGAPALVLDHDGDYYGDRSDQDYEQWNNEDRNRNRNRNRGAFSPGPFEDSPVDFRDNCISLDCSGRDRTPPQEGQTP